MVSDRHKFHRSSRLPARETRLQRQYRLAKKKEAEDEMAAYHADNARRAAERAVRVLDVNPPDFAEDYSAGPATYDGPSYWEDEENVDQHEETRAEIGSYYQGLIQQQRWRNWTDVFDALFPAYTLLKQVTNDWTLPGSFDDNSKKLCNCESHQKKTRPVDLVDLLGQQRKMISFCLCTPDPVQIMAHGYLASTPIFPQTAFSLRLLNFYDLLWNLCNAAATPFAEVLRRWNESISMRLYNKKETKPRDLRRTLIAAIDVYRLLLAKHRTVVETFSSDCPQDILAQRSCPACFGAALPVANPTQPADTQEIFVCLDGNFQHRHHERASKNHLPLQTPDMFLKPEEIDAAERNIISHEQAQKKTQIAKDRCSDQHKAADDKRNASTWKGCDDTGLMGCCCRHDSLVYFCNINRAGEGRCLPMAILERLFKEIQPQMKLRVLYDIGCSLDKFIKIRKLLPSETPRMKFATSIFHSYVHEWECQMKYNPRYNVGWGLSDGEGLERLWSYLSPLVSFLRNAARNHRLNCSTIAACSTTNW
ncbi:hypothetical protein PTTG_30297 [Puccinia triticina 1-1 BBBD Race 1]|uniref:CxC1 domain-containing protein n=1 Tax=Puccinia triticina (isolate 1-1 / race 1 (BBBD)) TaxID=630390 RepID=A0A180G005_PUCT1|nr:hypothetical protein PTTG_30297 [Puccinia triticina 1-1 BBBD Race 1]